MATGVLATPPILPFLLNNGAPAVGGFILTQVGGVNTATYQDLALSTPLPNPIPLNARGEVSDANGNSRQLFLTPNQVYTFTLYDGSSASPPYGNQVWQATYVNGIQLTGETAAAALNVVTDTAILASYLRTNGEIGAGITPSNYAYPPGHLYRYGTNAIPGTTDMTTALQSAVNQSAQPGGTAAYVPINNHKISSQITLAQNARLYGDGLGSQLTYTGGGVCLLASSVSVANWRKAEVNGIYVTTSTGTDGIKLSNVAEFIIRKCFFTGFSVAGIHLTGTVGQACICINIEDNECYSNTGDGLLADGINNINQVNVTGNRFQGNTGYGLHVANAGLGWSVTGNDLEGNTAGQAYFNGGNVSGLDYSGNYHETTVNQPCLTISDTQQVFGASVTGNYFAADIACTNAILLGKTAGGLNGGLIAGNAFVNLFTNAVNANIAQGLTVGPNYTSGGIVHLVRGAGLAALGVEERTQNGVAYSNAGKSNVRQFPTYGATVNINVALGETFCVQATNSTAFTIANPTNLNDGQIVTIVIINATGGALGAVTWGTAYKLAGASWTQPGASSQRAVTFYSDGTFLHEMYRSSADVA